MVCSDEEFGEVVPSVLGIQALYVMVRSVT